MIVTYTKSVTNADRVRFTPVIRINPKYKGDKGLLAHEQVHVLQWLAVGFSVGLPLLVFTNWLVALCVAITAHDVLYHFVRKYRLHAEVMAFKKQLHHGGSVELAAAHLANDYDLNVTKAEARRLLQ
jgi:hypothetical protein